MLEQTLYDNLTEIVVSIIQRGRHVNPDCFLTGKSKQICIPKPNMLSYMNVN